jgi:thermitase
MHRIARCALLASTCALVLAAPAQAKPGTVLVKFKPGVASAVQAQLLGGAPVVGTVAKLGVKVVKAAAPSTLVASLNRSALVQYAELDRTLRKLATPNDPQFGTLYGLNNTGQSGGTADADIDAPEGWNAPALASFPASGGAKIGIVDTGIRASHEDLAGKTVNCAGTAAGVLGLFGDPAASESRGCADDNGHGSHVAGTAASIANNARGVAGVSFNSPLGICKALHGAAGTGSTAGVANCIIYLADRSAKVISMSLGGGASTTLQNAVAYAAGKDVVLVAAAGNDGNSTLNYPAAYAQVISVAATDRNDNRASFSNANADVEIAAPGVDILSSWNSSDSAYNTISGTSMATPHVAGVAAVIRTLNSALNAAAVRTKLDGAVDDKGAAGRDPQYGFGRVNLQKAVS